MANLNRVFLIGNLTRDPEVRYTPKGTAVTELGLAVNRTYSTEQGEKKEETTFVDVEFWGRQAEVVGEYLKKGRPVFIEGRLKLDSWDDKQTGQKRSKLRVVGEGFQFLGGREGGPGGGGGSGGEEPGSERPPARSPAPSGRPAGRPAQPSSPAPSDRAPEEEDDIPF
jgi:single-strand DNA-binding protein